MGTYLRGLGPRAGTPGRERVTGRTDQVVNDAGGYVFLADDWERFRRFLILGTEGGSFYVGERELSRSSVELVVRVVREDGRRAVREITDVSRSGRAPRNDYAILALAVACAAEDVDVRRLAADAIRGVCRTGTHLFMFCSLVREYRGMGMTLRRGLAAWYENMPLSDLAYQLVKYRQRDGWTHRDVLRLARPRADSRERGALFAWACGKLDVAAGDAPALPDAIHAFEDVARADGEAGVVNAVRSYGNVLPREAIPPELLSAPVWRELLWAGMPLAALLRNLPTLTRLGVLGDRDARGLVTARLSDGDALRAARVHPVALLLAQLTYASGRSARGSATWVPDQMVADALHDGFYEAFENVVPSGKRLLVAVDVSGSMTAPIMGSPVITSRVAAAAMATVFARTERDVEFVAFSAGDGSREFWVPEAADKRSFAGSRGFVSRSALFPLGVSVRRRLNDFLREVDDLPFAGTDCALPMLYAREEGREFDGFVVLTDNEHWAGSVQPFQALEMYRAASGIPARFVSMAFSANDWSVSDPRDAGSLDVVGFDAAAPVLVNDFLRGDL